MKRFLSLAATMLALVFAASCTQEELGQKASDEAIGTLTVSLPDVATKVYGDGKYDAKNLIIGVFDENGVEKFRKNLVWEKEVFTQEVKIQFVMGKKYQMVLWAQYGSAYGAPETMPLDEITLDYKVSNREDLDAFYAYVPVFEVTKDFSKSVTLRRPFAQLNFATTVGDMDESVAAGDLGITNMAEVTVKNAANTLDLFTGKTTWVAADGTETPAGAEVVVPATAFPKVDGKYPTIEVADVVYEVIAMNYVLVADADAPTEGENAGKTTVDLKLKVGALEIEVPSAHMKRNWRTNVVGELLTGEGTFTVTIDPIFSGDFNENWNDGTGSENENEKPDEPEVEYSEWKLLGSHNKWASDVFMVLEDGLAVARDVEFPATKAEGDGEFKVTNGTDWYGMAVAATVGADKYLAATKENSAVNILVAPGKYDIWFDAAKAIIYVMTPGKAIKEATEFKAPQPEEPETDTWGIVGDMTNWGEGMADIAMTKKTVAEVEYWFADNFTVKDTDEFKFRLNGVWGTELTAGTVTPDKECAVAAGANNIKMAAGTYDVYLDVANSKLFMMTGDKTPADAGKVEMTDVEFYVVKADWNNNTLYVWDASNVTLAGIWPGKTTEEIVIINTVEYYKWTLSVPVDAIGKDIQVIFNDGKAAGALQTVDSPAFKLAEKQYFKTGDVDSEGKYALEQIEAPVVEEPEQPEPIVPAVALALGSTEPVPAEGGNVVVKVTSNVAWTLALDGTKVAEGAEAVTDFEVTVPVAANTATEVANHTLLLSDVPAEGAQAVIATAEFTQAAAQPEEPEVPEQPEQVKKLTVAEFKALEDGDTVYELSGAITGIYIPYDAHYNNISFYLSDATGEILIFRMSCEGVADPTSITVPDEITVQGAKTTYAQNGTAQMAAGSKYISHVDKEAPAPEEGSFTLDFSDKANRTEFDTEHQVWEQNGIKVTNEKGASTSNVADYVNPARFYKSSKLIVEFAGMTKIDFVCNSGSYATALAGSLPAGTNHKTNGSTVTVTLDTAADSYVIESLSGGQVRMNSITVYTK